MNTSSSTISVFSFTIISPSPLLQRHHPCPREEKARRSRRARLISYAEQRLRSAIGKSASDIATFITPTIFHLRRRRAADTVATSRGAAAPPRLRFSRHYRRRGVGVRLPSSSPSQRHRLHVLFRHFTILHIIAFSRQVALACCRHSRVTVTRHSTKSCHIIVEYHHSLHRHA